MVWLRLHIFLWLEWLLLSLFVETDIYFDSTKSYIAAKWSKVEETKIAPKKPIFRHFTPFRLKFRPTMAIGMETILLQNIHVKLMFHFCATSLLLTFEHYTTSHNIYYYSEKHRHTYGVLGTPLSLVGYLSTLQKQLFVLTNKGIWKKIYGDRAMRLTSVIEHSDW